MKKCVICGKEHQCGCDRSEWDGVLSHRFTIPVMPENVSFGGLHDTTQAYKITGTVIEKISKAEVEALKEQERQHVTKKRGRKPRNG